jgi:hypothetical protein
MPDRSDISPLSITDGKISKEARIGHSKLATAAEGQILVAQSNGKFAPKTLTGDVTIAADGSTTSSATSGGSTAVKGDKGDKGDKGVRGLKGDTGVQGATGTDATVTATSVDNALHGADTTTFGFVKRDANNSHTIDTSTYSTTGHNHDGSYYTETEADALHAAIISGYSSQISTVALDLVIGLAGKSATGHTHSQYSTFDIDDSSALTTDVWSASKIISYLSSTYATLANGFSSHKYTAAIQWERTLAISETGWAQGSGSGAWQANQTHASLAQTSTTGSGTGALFNVGVDASGVTTFIWVSGGGGYAVDDTLTFTDPGSTSQTCVVTVTTVFTPTGIGFSGTTGSMVCNLNHGLGTEYITMSVRGNDDVIEDLGHTSIVTVIDANNVKLEYGATDYPAVGEDKFITIIG